jgi:PAS domain S-box-containing protein
VTNDLLQQNRLLHEEIKRRIDQISAINTVSATVGVSLDLNVVLDTALRIISDVVGAEAAGISLIDEQTEEVVLRAQLGWIHDFVEDNPMRIPMGRGMSGEVIMEDKPIWRNDLTDDETYAVPRFGEEQFRSLVMAPMHARGKIIGILSIMSYKANQFDDAVVTVMTAIADTVGVFIENARLHEKHVENENRLRAILHSSADGILATDQNSRISLINYTGAQMLDVHARDLIGVPLREADIQVRVRDKLLLALGNTEEQLQTFRVTLETGRELSVLVSPVRIDQQVDKIGQQRDGWVIVLQDITHLREAELARVQFIQAAAHDMKNPLGVTQSSLAMLQSMIKSDDASIQEIFDIAQKGMQRLQRLIDNLLEIEKIQSGYGFHQEAVDIREMVFEIGAQVRPLLMQKAITFDTLVADDVPIDWTLDRDWISRAIYNYLENAAKYTGDGGHVTCRVYLHEADLCLEVADDGPGIPAQAQSRLFDRFYRVEERLDVSGSGLGLAIVKSVAEAHGGYVYVKSDYVKEDEINSDEQRGSCFGLCLPHHNGRGHRD